MLGVYINKAVLYSEILGFTSDYISHDEPDDTGSSYVFIFATVQKASTETASYRFRNELVLSPAKEYSKNR